ncbi:MAG: xanthine dehydrogenase family protein subunit M [Anaerolineaceae bacterium]
MERIKYVRPSNFIEAVDLLNQPGMNNYVLAGGTDLMLIIRQDKKISGRLVDITLIPEMHEIKRSGGSVFIGAAATFSEILNNPIINETAPVLAQAAHQVGAAQIRNMGTIGGNVANAAACADSIPALVCLDAIAMIKTMDDEQEIPVADLITSPNKTKIPPGGLITSFKYKIPDPGSRSAFYKLGRRNAMAISRLTVAALGRLNDDHTIAEARFVTGSATPRICRLGVVEDSLIGRKPTPEQLQSSANLAVDEMIRLAGKRWSSEFKMPALAAMTVQVFSQVFINEQFGQEN